MTKIRLFEYAITLNLIILAMEYADVAQTNFAVMRTFFIITVLKVFKIVKIYFHSAKLLIINYIFSTKILLFKSFNTEGVLIRTTSNFKKKIETFSFILSLRLTL